MTYEYECRFCGVIEVEQAITDPPLTTCPTLHGAIRCGFPIKRLVASPAFVLKGSGWAKDGYGRGGTG